MCLNRPKIPSGEYTPTYIKVGENTNKSKYEFLRLFYTKWNQITKPSPRVIIDTHAGTGMVNLITKTRLLNISYSKLIYGSPLLAILKTLKISNNLKLIFNEPDEYNAYLLEKCLRVIEKRGLPIFKKPTQDFIYKSFQTNRRRKKKQSEEIFFPDSFDSRPPRGFSRNWIKSKAYILLFNKKIELTIDTIIDNYLNTLDKKTNLKPKALFFVDPCGIVGWNEVIKKICIHANRQEGTDMILNWSWDAISRNLNNESKNSVLSSVYGFPIEQIDEEFERTYSMEDFFKKYKRQLSEYFKHAVEVGVPRDRKIKPRQSKYKKYYLILCTNNPSALSLAGYQIEKIKENIRGKFKDLKTFI